MYYAPLPVYAKTGPSNPNENMTYKIPIIASDLYDRRPDPDAGSNVIIATGRTEGYPDITSLFMEVCDACGFNPFKIRSFHINDGGAATMIKTVIEDFMGEVETDNYNWNLFYPDYGGGDTTKAVGPFLFGPGYSLSQAAYGTTPYGNNPYIADVLYHWVRQATFFTSNDGITGSFEIWPEDSIKSGTIDTSKFSRSSSLIEACALIVNIWCRESSDPEVESTYNYSVQLKGYRYNSNRTTFIDNRLDGVDLDHVYNPANPYDNKQQDGDEGGDKDWDNGSDPIDVPPLPNLDITANGGIELFIVNGTAFSSLLSYMASNNPVDAIVKWFNNPIQAIASCYYVPYPISRGTAKEISILGSHSGVSAPTADPWTEHNMGSVYLPYGFGDTFLDYSPWTKVSIYLPFCGIKQLNADDTVGKNIGVVYQFDNFSGACVVYVTCNGTVRYTFTGSSAVGIPISQENWGQTYIAIAQAATAVVGAAISGGAAAAAGATSAADMAIGAGKEALVKAGGELAGFSGKPTISRSGSFCAAASALGYPSPFLIIERPDKAKIENPKSVIGLTSGRTLSLGSLSGFTMIEQVHLHGINATGPELDEIESLLHQGVIL